MSIVSFLFVALLAFSCSSENSNILYLFTWTGLLKPEMIAKFEEKYHCRVVIDTYDSNESMYAKLKLGSGGYDIIFPSSYYLDILYKQGIIQALDSNNLPNLKNLDPRYYKGKEPILCVPFIVSFSALAYRTDRNLNMEPSYEVFGRADLKGRMTMLNDLRESLGAALKYKGYSVNTRDREQVEQAADLLIDCKKNLAKFETEQAKNGLATGEFLVIQGYTIDVMQLKDDGEKVDLLFPKEGAILSVDCMALLKRAKHVELAYAFMNFMTEPENAAENMLYSFGLIPVMPAYDLLDEDLRNSPILFPPDEVLDKMEQIEDLQQDIKIYYKAWERVRGT